MTKYSDKLSGDTALVKRLFRLILSTCLLWITSSACPAELGNWLVLEGGGTKIVKRFGLPEGERLTMTLFPPVRYKPGLTLQRFYELIDEDLPRLGVVINRYHTKIMESYGLSVIFTLRRYYDRSGARRLVYYQGFYRPGVNRMWFVRTDLNDNLALLINHYEEALDIIMDWIGIMKTMRHLRPQDAVDNSPKVY